MQYLIAFLISMLPLVELRGGLIYAAAAGIDFPQAFAICLAGNLLPIPFIIIFLRKIFDLLRRFRHTKGLVTKLEEKAHKAEERIRRYEIVGLYTFVAIPLPGTGAWTGALIAVVLDLQMKRALPAILLGVLTAGIIMSIVSYAIPGLFFSFIS